MSYTIPKKVLMQCGIFALRNKIPVEQQPYLLEMAMRSYRALSVIDRLKWTLEEVVKQGIVMHTPPQDTAAS